MHNELPCLAGNKLLVICGNGVSSKFSINKYTSIYLEQNQINQPTKKNEDRKSKQKITTLIAQHVN